MVSKSIWVGNKR